MSLLPVAGSNEFPGIEDGGDTGKEKDIKKKIRPISIIYASFGEKQRGFFLIFGNIWPHGLRPVDLVAKLILQKLCDFGMVRARRYKFQIKLPY